MNGKKDVLLFNVGSDKNFTEASKTTKVPAGTKANGWTLKLKATTKAGADNTTYWVDGEKLTVYYQWECLQHPHWYQTRSRLGILHRH